LVISPVFVLVRTWCCTELDRSRGNGVRVYKTGLVFATRRSCAHSIVTVAAPARCALVCNSLDKLSAVSYDPFISRITHRWWVMTQQMLQGQFSQGGATL